MTDAAHFGQMLRYAFCCIMDRAHQFLSVLQVHCRRKGRCAQSSVGTELGVSSSVFGTSDSLSGTSGKKLKGVLGASSFFAGSRLIVGSA